MPANWRNVVPKVYIPKWHFVEYVELRAFLTKFELNSFHRERSFRAGYEEPEGEQKKAHFCRGDFSLASPLEVGARRAENL